MHTRAALRTATLLVTLVATLAATAANGAIYWSNGSSFGGPSGTVGLEIGRANLDGTRSDRYWWDVGDAPADLEVRGDWLYWPTYRGIVRGNRVTRALDRDFIRLGGDACEFECQIALTDTHLYWTDSDHGYVGRARLDGTVVEPQWHLTDEFTQLAEIAADAADLYVVTYRGDILRIPQGDPTASATFVDSTEAGMETIASLAVDDTYLYYGGYEAGRNLRGHIGRAATTGGSAPEPEWYSQASGAPDDPQWYPSGLAVDGTHLYFAAEAVESRNLNGAIGRIRLADGHDQPFLIAENSDLFAPYALAVDDTVVTTPAGGVDDVVVDTPRRLRVRTKRVRIPVRVTAGERDVAITWKGEVRAGRKSFRLKTVRRDLETRDSIRRKLRITGDKADRRRGERSILRRLDRDKRVVAKVVVKMRDVHDNRRSVRRTIRLR